MNADELRTRFFEFAGAERFRKFVIALRGRSPKEAKFELRPRHARLSYWQEQLWQAFAATADAVTNDLDEIHEALLWCDVHQRYLQQGKAVPDSCGVTDREGNDIDPTFTDARCRSFPFGCGYWTLVCPDCVDACRAWMQARRAELTRKPE